MKYFLACVLATFALISAQAQEPVDLTLDECVRYALENQVNIRNARLDTEISRARVGEVRAIGLPQINGEVALVDNTELRRMFMEGGNPFLPPGFGQPGEVLAIPNVFQLRSSGDAGLSISQLLFDGSYFVGLQAARTYNELASKSLQQSTINTVEAVQKAYYLVLINRERLGLIEANIVRVDTILRQTRNMFLEGYVERIDVDRLEVNYNNLITERSRFTSLLSISEALLKYQMGMPVATPVNVVGDLSTISFDRPGEETAVDPNSRVEYSLLGTRRELDRLNLRNERVAFLPRLAAFASGGFFTQHNAFMNLFNNPWYTYSQVGLSLRVPILDGFGRNYRVKQARLQMEKTDNDLYNLENTINLQVQQSRASMINSIEALQAQQRNMRLAEEVARTAKIKYQEGVGSNLELVTAETAFKEAQTNYYNALYEAVLADIDLKLAMGTLYQDQ